MVAGARPDGLALLQSPSGGGPGAVELELRSTPDRAVEPGVCVATRCQSRYEYPGVGFLCWKRGLMSGQGLDVQNASRVLGQRRLVLATFTAVGVSLGLILFF